MAKIIDTAAERLEILERYRRIAMVGLSGNPYRPSHFAAIYMQPLRRDLHAGAGL